MALYAFDGSWKDSNIDPEYEHTNVHHFKELYGDSQEQNACYWHGVGTRKGRIGKYVGGALGAGTEVRLAEALVRLSKLFAKGDEVIDIVGFSRGAATAAAFAWSLHKWGVRKPRGRRTSRYLSKLLNLKHDALNYRSGELIAGNPTIRFVGLFDMVFSTEALLGAIPFWEFQRTKGAIPLVPSRDFRLPNNVSSAFHALAIHERTFGFEATRTGNAYECWFPGVHSDIGGGGRERSITDTTLRWMVSKAKSVGVPVDSDNTLTNSGGSLPVGVTSDSERLDRIIRPGDRLHESAYDLPVDIKYDEMILE